MDYFRLKVFEAVYSGGSCTGAARRLGVTQPAVSQHIAELERELGVALFTRTGPRGRMEPTPAAEILMPRAVRLLKDFDDIGTLFSPAAARFGEVRVRADALAAGTVMEDLLASLRALFPGTLFTFLPADSADKSSSVTPAGHESSSDTPDSHSGGSSAASCEVELKTGTSRQGDSRVLVFDVSGQAPFVEIIRLLLGVD